MFNLENEDIKRKVIELRNKGFTYQGISKELSNKITVRAISRFLKKYTFLEWWDNNTDIAVNDACACVGMDNDEVKVEVLRYKSDGLGNKMISQQVGLSVDTVRRFLDRVTYRDWWDSHDKPLAAGELSDHHENTETLGEGVYVFTSAQNNTYIHSGFFDSIKQLLNHRNAELIIGTFTYNKSGFQNLVKDDDSVWFDPKIRDYISDKPIKICDGLLWCGELNILPTAVDPLSGLESYTRSDSGIFPHCKVAMKSTPRQPDESFKAIYTTGTITKRNYIQKKAGQKASFHHVFGALIVEVDCDGDWFVRQLVADKTTGAFQDLDVLYTPTGVFEKQRVEAVNWGDIHLEMKDDDVYETSFSTNPDSMLNVLKPKFQFLHDTIHFQARNHHNRKDPHFMFQMFVDKTEDVKEEVIEVANFIKYVGRPDCKIIVVDSNHDRAFCRWLKETDYRQDPINAVYFLENQLKLYRSILDGDKSYNVFYNAVKEFIDDETNITFLNEDESFLICDEDGTGIECGSHGDRGINGSRGSPKAFSKAGRRYNTGHTHSAGIIDGVYTSGVTGRMKQGYNYGITTWSHSHIVTNPLGKRQIITLKNNKWRGEF